MNVHPTPKRYGLRIDPRAATVPEQGDERHVAGRRLVEGRGFWSARIHGRDRQRLCDVAERVGIADGQIVESALNAGVPTDWEIRLVSLDVERLAVNTADPEPHITGLARRQRHRKVVLARLRTTRPRVKDGIGRDLVLKVVSIDHMHPLRKTRPKGMPWSPHRFRSQGVMVAGDKEHGSMRRGLIPQHLDEPLPKVRTRCRIVKQIARAQNSVDAVPSRHIEDPRDHLHPRPRQLLLRLLGK